MICRPFPTAAPFCWVALDADRLEQAVKVAADLAAELRTPAAAALSPKSYYDIYLAVASELRLLEIYVSELARRGTPVLTLYERVQETPLVLPRLYLLISIGSVYVKSMQADAAEVLRDLVEMCAGVQHPQRGLFLRAYLLQMMKDKLPDVGNPYGRRKKKGAEIDEDDESDSEKRKERDAVDVADSVSFVLRNFTEMNRLWVRSQHDVAPREADIERREQERRQLRLLVGSNISTLSRLQGVDLPMYKKTVFPAVLDQIVSCHDAIAQEYLADCVAQVFPDEFQLATLDHFLSMCGHLVRGVNLKVILTSVIDRLTRYATQSPENAARVREYRAFGTFRVHLLPIMHRQRATLPIADRLRVFLALERFALETDSGNLTQVDDVLGFAVQTARELSSGDSGVNGDASTNEDGYTAANTAVPMTSRDDSGVSGGLGAEGAGQYSSTAPGAGAAHLPIPPGDSLFTAEEEDLVIRLLTLPLESHNSMASALSLTNYGALQNYLRYRTRRRLAVTLLRSVHDYKPCISKVALLSKLFDYVSCLAEDPPRVDANGEFCSPDSALSPDAMFDSSSLSPHHDFILGSIPGVASFVPPTEPDLVMGSGHVRFANGLDAPSAGDDEGAGDQGGAGGADDDLDGFGSPSVGGEDGARDFQQGQELIARIVYFCEEADLEAAFALHVALRGRLMRGGDTRVPITLPPLVLATLRMCSRAGVAAANLSMANGLEVARRGLHFVVETVDSMRAISPESALRLYLQTAQTAAAVYQRTGTLVAASAGEPAAAHAEGVQQHVDESLSRAFEVFEAGIVSGRSQFTALELIISSLASVGGALETSVYDSLAGRTVKHARRLLTRSDQCLALCACADLFWQVRVDRPGHPVDEVAPKDLGRSSPAKRGIGGREDGNSRVDDGESEEVVHRSVGGVLVCMNSAIDAARGCVNDGERALLLIDVAQRLVRLALEGCGSSCTDGRLDDVIGEARVILEDRRAKASVVGRAVATRLERLRKHIKANPNEFAKLGLKNV